MHIICSTVLYKFTESSSTDETCVEVEISSKGAVTDDPHPNHLGYIPGTWSTAKDAPQWLHTHTHTHTHTRTQLIVAYYVPPIVV